MLPTKHSPLPYSESHPPIVPSHNQAGSSAAFRRFEMPPRLRAAIAQLAGSHRGLDGRYALPTQFHTAPHLDYDTAKNTFLELRDDLHVNAQSYFKGLVTMPQSNTSVRLPPRVAHALKTTSTQKQFIKNVFRFSRGLVVGEAHHAMESKRFIIAHMATLRRQGVRTLYMEHLLSDAHQSLLDTYFASQGETLPAELLSYLNALDKRYHTDSAGQYTFLRVVTTAKKYGIKIVALDCYASYYLKDLRDRTGGLRQKIMNYYAYQVIKHYQSQTDAGNWIALVGETHSNRLGELPGLAELTRVVGLRVAHGAALLSSSTEQATASSNGRTWSIHVDDGAAYTDHSPGRLARLEYLKGDLLLTPDSTGGEYLQNIEAKLRKPGQFLFCTAPNSADLILWHRSLRGELLPTPIHYDQYEGNKHIYIDNARPRWQRVNKKRYATLDALSMSLVSELAMERVAELPRPLSKPPASSTQTVRNASLEAYGLTEQFELARNTQLLELSAFASAAEREEFLLGKRQAAEILAAFPLNSEGEVQDIRPYETTKLMQLFGAPKRTLTLREQGALLQAIHDRKTAQLVAYALRWKANIEALGGCNTQAIVQNLYLAAAGRRQGLCSAIAAHIAATALYDVSGDGTAHYLRKLSAAIEQPEQPSAKLLGLALLEWASTADQNKFAHSATLTGQTVEQISQQLRYNRNSAAYELSIGRHAIVVGTQSREGKLTYYLADPNYGYSEFSSQASFEEALRFEHILLRQQGQASPDAHFTLRAYRADLAKQLLFRDQPSSRLRSHVLRLADLAEAAQLSTKFNGDASLENDHCFKKNLQRLLVTEYRYWLTSQGKKLPGTPIVALIEKILKKHGWPPSARPSDTGIELQFSADGATVLRKRRGEISNVIHIDGQRYPNDVKKLRRYQQFCAEVFQPRTLLSQFFVRRPAIALDSYYLASALADGPAPVWNAIEHMQQYVQAHPPKPLALAEPLAIDELSLHLLLERQQAAHQGQDLVGAMAALFPDEHERNRLIPLFEGIETHQGKHYRIPFICRDKPNKILYRTTQDSRFIETQHYINRKLNAFRASRPLFAVNGLGEEADIVDGLSAAFGLEALWRFLNHNAQTDDVETALAKNLGLSIKIHDALTALQLGVGLLHDTQVLVKIIHLVKQTAFGSADIMPWSTLMRGPLSLIGLALQAGTVGLDIYELTRARGEVQYGALAARLGVDSVGLGIGLTGVVLASPAVALGGALVTGVGVAISGLVQVYLEVAHNAATVGQYFAQLKAAYTTVGPSEGGGYRYEAEHQFLRPIQPAVIDAIDLITRQVHFSSPKLYRTHHGPTGSGAQNYFFWAGDAPQLVADRTQALDVRTRLGLPSQAPLPVGSGAAKAFVLPGVPKSYIRYTYNTLPGATARHDAGFAELRQLEEQRDFDFDYYTFPSEYIIDSITMEYVSTSVNIFLDNEIRSIHLPELPPELHGYMHYRLYGWDGQYAVSLNTGASLTLAANAAGKPSWLLDARVIPNNGLTFERRRVWVGAMCVNITENTGPIYLTKGTGEVWQIDVEQQTQTLVDVDVSSWAQQHVNVAQRLAEQRTAAHHADYVVVQHYAAANGKIYPSAYYDVKRARYLYAQDYPEAVLAAVHGDDVYFYHRENNPNEVIVVDAVTGKTRCLYQARDGAHGLKVWQEHGTLLLAVRSVTHNEIIYQLSGETLTLRMVHIGKEDALNRHLATHSVLSDVKATLIKYLDSIRSVPTADPVGVAILPIEGEIMIDASFKGKLVQRYWIETQSGNIVKPQLPCTTASGSADYPNDLAWVRTAYPLSGETVNFFYSAHEQRVYRYAAQETSATLCATHIVALQTPEGRYGPLYIENADGRIQCLDSAGQTTLSSVTRSWVQAHPLWWEALHEPAKANAVSVLGLKGPDGQDLAIWSVQDRLVVAPPSLGTKIELLGLSEDHKQAWLYHRTHKKLYVQPTLEGLALATLFDTKLNMTREPPDAMALGRLTELEKLGKTLAVTPEENAFIPLLAGIDQLILQLPSTGKIVVNQQMWAHYSSILIDPSRFGQKTAAPWTLALNLANPLALQVEQDAKDWILFDRVSGKTLRIKDGEDTGKTLSIVVQLPGDKTTSFTVDTLANRLKCHGQPAIEQLAVSSAVLNAVGSIPTTVETRNMMENKHSQPIPQLIQAINALPSNAYPNASVVHHGAAPPDQALTLVVTS